MVATLVAMHALPQWKASAIVKDASFVFSLVIEESATVIGQNEGRIQSERKLPGAPDEGEIIKRERGRDVQMQQQEKNKKKRNEARIRQYGKKRKKRKRRTPSKLAMMRILCRKKGGGGGGSVLKERKMEA